MGSSPIQEVDVRSVDDAHLLHGLLEIRGLRERPCPVEVLGLEQQDHFVRVVGSPQEVLLREARGGALGEVRVVAGLPAREVPDLVADEQIAWHGRSPFVLTWWRSRVRRSLDVPRIGRRGYLRQVAFTV